ncbi:MAG: RNA polymerase sigma factor, partial [Lachnospiraceae bacterium]|nr:RNA polymerase sigma factor [Lachnospiraceae bacterium]
MAASTGQHPYTFETAVPSALHGEQEAFRFLYESVYREKYFMALQYMKNRSDAEDVLQDAYLRAWKNLEKLKDPGKFPLWFSSIVAHTALNALKKKQPLLFSDLLAKNEDGEEYAREQEDFRREYQPEHAYTEKERSEILHGMIDSLSDEQRMCVLMYYIEEQSVKEIAAAAGCPENTVKTRLNLGRKKLAEKADELQQKGYSLYGLSGVVLLRYLLRSAGIPQETAGAADMAMHASAKQVLAEAVLSAAGGNAGAAVTGMASAGTAVSGFAWKTVMAVLGVVVIGGGAYAVLRGGGGNAPNAETAVRSSDTLTTGEQQISSDIQDSSEPQSSSDIQDSSEPRSSSDIQDSSGLPGGGEEDEDTAPADDGLTDEATARAAQQDLPDEAKAEFDRLLSLVGENSDVLWAYMDDDKYPEMVIRDRDSAADQNLLLCRIYYGNTTGELQGKNYINGVIADYVPTTANEYERTARNPQHYYFVPRKGILVNDEVVAGEEMRLIAVMNEEKVVELKYVVGRRSFTVDESTGVPQRVELPAGEYAYYITEFYESENINETQIIRDISKEEYEMLYHVGHLTELFSYDPE